MQRRCAPQRPTSIHFRTNLRLRGKLRSQRSHRRPELCGNNCIASTLVIRISQGGSVFNPQSCQVVTQRKQFIFVRTVRCAEGHSMGRCGRLAEC